MGIDIKAFAFLEEQNSVAKENNKQTAFKYLTASRQFLLFFFDCTNALNFVHTVERIDV